MNGEICLEEYNETVKVPLMLSGGHTFGKKGLEDPAVNNGPNGRILIDTPISSLKRNFALVKMGNEVNELLHDITISKNQNLVYGNEGNQLAYCDSMQNHRNHNCTFLTQLKSGKLYPLKLLIEDFKNESSKILHSIELGFQCLEEAKESIESHIDEEVNSAIKKIKEKADELKKSMYDEYKENLRIPILNEFLDFSKNLYPKQEEIIEEVIKTGQLNFEGLELIKSGQALIEKIKSLKKDEIKPIPFDWGDLNETEIEDAISESCRSDRYSSLIDRYFNKIYNEMDSNYGKESSTSYVEFLIDKNINKLKSDELSKIFKKDLQCSILNGSNDLDGVEKIIRMLEWIKEVYKYVYIDEDLCYLDLGISEDITQYHQFYQNMKDKIDSFIISINEIIATEYEATMRYIENIKEFLDSFAEKCKEIKSLSEKIRSDD